MAYKIVKYKGKTKIKNTKTGKSAEIDIEKFMNGGYKTISEYALGGEECPEGDVECMERNKIGMPPSFTSDLRGFVPQNPMLNNSQALVNSTNSPIIDENTIKPNVEPISSLKPEGLAPSDNFSKITASGIYGELDSKTADVEVKETDSEQVENNYTIPNPYAGVDIPTAAFTLGQSIENKNTLGKVGSGLKLLTGLGRNVASGIGQQNRYNQVMKDYYENQKKDKNPVQYFSYGGKKDEELATGEYMHGVSNEDVEKYNAEIEQGEYFQTNEGDIAEVVGKKHSQGGEKIQMEEEDRVLSDKLKLGGKTAKMLSSKYDLKLKAKNTYSDVLDKFRKKMKLDTLLDEESDILKKIGDQDKVEDFNTKNFNLQVLAQKKEEINKQKHPIEEMRKEMFEELFNIQEESKTGNKKNKFERGGEKEETDLDQEDVQSINESTGADFTLEGVNELFEIDNKNSIEPINPELNLGKYEGLNYFNLDYNGDEITVSPTKNNPGNAAKHREYLKYLQKQNPDLKINTKANVNGYIPMNQRLEYGGKLGELAKEYNIPLERAEQLVQEFSKGGKIVPEYETATGECPEGYKKNKKGECEKLDKEEAEALSFVPEGQSRDISTSLFGKVTPESFQASKDRNKWFFDQNPNFDVTDSNQVLQYQRQYNQIAERLGAPTVSEDGKWGQQTDSIDVRKFYKTTPLQEEEIVSEDSEVFGGVGPYLFPNESPLPPSALQGTIKPERRFDRVRPSEINVEPYLQDIKDREESQVQSLEGLSPNVRAAVLANMRANNQKAESDIRNQIDTQNLNSQEKAIYTNAQIQAREENASEQDRLAYEQRQYRAQALTDNDINNYFNQLQAINKQRFMDINNLNLINQTNEDVAYVPGRGFIRKNSDQEILRKINV